MVVDTTKIVGTFDGVEVVNVNIGMFCTNEAVLNICDILRKEANDCNKSITFTVTITMEDI